MSILADAIKGDIFSAASLTAAINQRPNLYGKVGAMNIFQPKPIETTMAMIETQGSTLNLVPTTPRGTPGSKNARGLRNMRSFFVPHFRVEDVLRATDIQNKRAFGQTDQLDPVTAAIIRSQDEMATKLDLTREYLRVQALTGKIVEPGGTTLYDLFTELGLTQKVINCALATGTTDVSGKIREGQDHIDLKLTGSYSSGTYIALCSTTFFNGFVSHPKIETAYAHYQNTNASPLRDDVRQGFWHQNTLFISYPANGTVLNQDGTMTSKKFITEGEAIMVPLDTSDIFFEAIAPVDHLDFVNQLCPPIVSWSEERGGAVEMFAESNPLSICSKPEVLVRLTMA